MTLKQRLMFGFISAQIAVCLFMALLLWYYGHNGMAKIGSAGSAATQERALEQLASIRSAKAQHIEDLFTRIRSQALSQAESLTVREAAQTLGSAYYTIQGETIGKMDYREIKGMLLQDYTSSNYLKNPGFAEHNAVAPGYSPRAAEKYLPPDANGILLQGMYVLSSGNPNSIGQKHKLDASAVHTTYNTLHAKFHPILRHYLETFNYYDIFIIDGISGNIIYSVFKEKDFATSLITGPYKDTGLGDAFRKAAEAGKKGLHNVAFFADFAPYEASYNAPSAFVAAPVYNSNNTFIAVVAFQLPEDTINGIMTSGGKWREVGLGESGETYLVGPDMKTRSLLRDSTAHGILETSVATEATRKAQASDTGHGSITDYRGKQVFAAWQPLKIDGLQYSLIAEIDQTEALAAARDIASTQSSAEARMLGSAAITMLLGILAASGLAIVLVGSLARQLQRLQTYAGEVAEGHLDARPEGTYPAELDSMRHSIERMVQHLRQRIGEADAKGEEATRSAQAAQEALEKARQSEQRIKGLMERMTGAASKARSVSDNVSQSINELTSQISAITTGVQTQRSRMDDTAHAMDDMRNMVTDVADNARRAATQADLSRANAEKGATGVRTAVAAIEGVREDIERLNVAMSRLGEEADSIGKVMSVISDIADQTNLLALNAAIEAARAGDAGRGFAVVADEVRKLAEKTMTATREVGEAVSRIQTHTRENIAAVENTVRETTQAAMAAESSGTIMGNIVSLVDETAGMVQTIASASDQQAADSETVGRNVADVSRIAAETASGMTTFASTLHDIFAQVQELFSMIEVISTGEDGVSVLADAHDSSTLVRWSDELANLPSIDEQHKTLIDIINKLHVAARSRDNARVLSLFGELREYTVSHFGYEEELFRKYNYPEAREHAEVHKRFVEKVLAWERQCTLGEANPMDILRGLVDWLVSHIMKVDKRYHAFLRDRGAH